MAHSKLFSFSAGPRWMRCPGSVALTKDMPDESSKFAEEGTLAHECGALMLQFDAPYMPKGADEDMLADTSVYVDSVKAEQERTQGMLYVEIAVDFSAVLGVEGGTGTADAIIVETISQILGYHAPLQRPVPHFVKRVTLQNDIAERTDKNL